MCLAWPWWISGKDLIQLDLVRACQQVISSFNSAHHTKPKYDQKYWSFKQFYIWFFSSKSEILIKIGVIFYPKKVKLGEFNAIVQHFWSHYGPVCIVIETNLHVSNIELEAVVWPGLLAKNERSSHCICPTIWLYQQGRLVAFSQQIVAMLTSLSRS